MGGTVLEVKVVVLQTSIKAIAMVIATNEGLVMVAYETWEKEVVLLNEEFETGICVFYVKCKSLNHWKLVLECDDKYN